MNSRPKNQNQRIYIICIKDKANFFYDHNSNSWAEGMVQW